MCSYPQAQSAPATPCAPTGMASQLHRLSCYRQQDLPSLLRHRWRTAATAPLQPAAAPAGLARPQSQRCPAMATRPLRSLCRCACRAVSQSQPMFGVVTPALSVHHVRRAAVQCRGASDTCYSAAMRHAPQATGHDEYSCAYSDCRWATLGTRAAASRAPRSTSASATSVHACCCSANAAHARLQA